MQLVDGWFWKAVVSALGGLLVHDVQLVVLVSFLVVVDLITGLWKAFRNDDLNATQMRQTGIKVIEYAILLSVIGALSNAFGALSWAVHTAYLYVSMTEVTSIVENIAESREKEGVVSKVWDQIKGRIERRIGQKTSETDTDNS